MSTYSATHVSIIGPCSVSWLALDLVCSTFALLFALLFALALPFALLWGASWDAAGLGLAWRGVALLCVAFLLFCFAALFL